MDNIVRWNGTVWNEIQVDKERDLVISGQFTKGPYPRAKREDVKADLNSFTCDYCGTHDFTQNLRGQLECCGCSHPIQQVQKTKQSRYFAPVMNFNVRENFTDEEIALAMRSILNEL